MSKRDEYCISDCPICDSKTRCEFLGMDERGESLKCKSCGTKFTIYQTVLSETTQPE